MGRRPNNDTLPKPRCRFGFRRSAGLRAGSCKVCFHGKNGRAARGLSFCCHPDRSGGISRRQARFFCLLLAGVLPFRVNALDQSDLFLPRHRLICFSGAIAAASQVPSQETSRQARYSLANPWTRPCLCWYTRRARSVVTPVQSSGAAWHHVPAEGFTHGLKLPAGNRAGRREISPLRSR